MAATSRFLSISGYNDGGGMIVVCEPLCKKVSHEKVNSGFIYGLRKAFPDDEIVFYADSSHILAIQQILHHDNLVIPNITYVPIKFYTDTGSISAFINYYFLFKKLFTQVINLSVNKIFFLSFSPPILYLIKKIKSEKRFSLLKFTFVLHWDFENINENKQLITTNSPEQTISKKLKKQLLKLPLTDIIKKGLLFGRKKFADIIGVFAKQFNKLFTTKSMLLLNYSADYRYVALAPYIIENAAEYIDVEKLNLFSVILPTVFASPIAQPQNDYAKFAIFGLGNPKKLQGILLKLSDRELNNPYEIKIIGMNSLGLEDIPNVYCPSPGRRLTRDEMEQQALDVDVFLNVYEKSLYRLSCSNSILESLSYMKPVLHFDNDCLNFFNKKDLPIGICCNTEEEYVDFMADIINDYKTYQDKFSVYRKNILLLREKFAIDNSIESIRNSFTW